MTEFKEGDLVQGRDLSAHDGGVGLVVEIKPCGGTVGSWIGVVWAYKPGIMIWSDPRDIRGCQSD